MSSPMDTTKDVSEKPHDTTPTTIKKLAPLPKGAKVKRRALAEQPQQKQNERRIYVNRKTPFRSVTARVRKHLDKSLRQASYSNKAFTNRLASNRKHAGLEERIRAIQQHTESARDSGVGLEHAEHVLVLGTGRAIEKVLEVASFFQKQGDCIVQLRTTSLGAVDDVVVEGEDDEEELGLASNQSEVRQRMVSCLEVTIKLR